MLCVKSEKQSSLRKAIFSKHNNNPSADGTHNKWLKSFYEDMGWKPVFYNWDKPITNTTTTTTIDFYKLIKHHKSNRLS